MIGFNIIRYNSEEKDFRRDKVLVPSERRCQKTNLDKFVLISAENKELHSAFILKNS